MEKLRFDFAVKATVDGKSNTLVLTSIGMTDGRSFNIPEEVRAMNLHTVLAKTTAFTRIRNTLKKRPNVEDLDNLNGGVEECILR